MNVHNLMEDLVIQNVNDMYEQVKDAKAAWLSCDCENCRLDTVSYVLNRIPPKYIVSGRGVTHATETLNDKQLLADVNALILEGMRTVSSTKRPFHNNDRKECEVIADNTPSFNFPTFTGTILDGSTFEPITDASITMKMDGEIVEMIDKTWTNPYTTCRSTRGTFSFWAKSITAEKEGENKRFTFTFEISAPGYSGTIYNIVVPVISEQSSRKEIDSTYFLKLKDFILFKEGIENPME